MRAHLRRCLYTADLQKRLTHTVTHTVTHTRKRADGSSGNRDVKEYFNSSENDQKRPENDIFRIFLLFVISRSGVRVRLPAPIFPQRSKVNMGEFPSGQRGQTVNLLSMTSVVRIHLPPPVKSLEITRFQGFLLTCRTHFGTLNHLQAIIDDAYAEKHLAKKTLQDLRGCISGFLRFCRLGKYTTLVSMDLQIPRSAKRPHKNILGAQELQNLFILENTVLNGKSQPDWCIHAYRFSVLNGLRPGELIGLRWEDIQGNILHIDRSVNHYKEVTEGKNENSQREIFLQGLAMAELEAQRQQLRQAGIISPWVFPNEHGACFTQSTFRKRWNRYCSVNNIQNITLYELRHTFVSVCDDMPDGLKKKVVGHSQSMDTDGIYGHRKVGDLERAAAYSDAAFRAIL